MGPLRRLGRWIRHPKETSRGDVKDLPGSEESERKDRRARQLWIWRKRP